MSKFFFIASVLLFSSGCLSKIIGLMPVRNEKTIIEQSLRAMACIVNEIIVLDDGSCDETVRIVKNLRNELPIVEIIESKYSYWEKGTEAEKRQKLLDAGRAHHGDCFLLLDADEIITANCIKNNFLKNKIKNLKKGQMLCLQMIHLWKGVTHYRSDASRWSPQNCIIGCAFKDDGFAHYNDNLKDSASGFIHMSRIPKNLPDIPPLRIDDVEFCVMHFRFAQWENVLIKRAWYMCLELIRAQELQNSNKPARTAEEINEFYTRNEPFDDHDAHFKEINPDWYAYPFFNALCFLEPISWRKDQIKQWFSVYGTEFFKKLDIWNIDWS